MEIMNLPTKYMIHLIYRNPTHVLRHRQSTRFADCLYLTHWYKNCRIDSYRWTLNYFKSKKGIHG